MHNFRRALTKALRYWPSIALATLASLGVAALWGANIGAFYPILQITIGGQSINEWVSTEIDSAEQMLDKIEQQLATLPERPKGLDSAIDLQRQRLEQQRGVALSKQNSYRKMQPWLDWIGPMNPFQTVSWIVALVMISTLVKHLLMVINEVLVGRVATDISRSIRMDIFHKAIHMDRPSYAKYGTGGISAQITHTCDMLSNGLMNAIGGLSRESLKLASCFIGAALICWRLLLSSCIVAPVGGGLLFWITRRLKGISRKSLTRAQGYHDVLIESLSNINTVQAYGMEMHEEERFSAATASMRSMIRKFIFYTALSKPVIEFLGLGMLGVTIVGGSHLVLNQETHLLGIPVCSEPLSISALLIFFGFLVSASDPLRKLSAVYSSVYAGAIAADSLYGLLDTPNQIRETTSPRTLSRPHHRLRLNQVQFGYRPDQLILDDVSLDIPFGSTIAIVGPNGSGKSTLIHLLCRFYDPIKGGLELDGVDIRDMSISDLRGRIALVTQHTELFNQTVDFNIRYGSPNASTQDVRAASEQAHAHDFISKRLPEGYETMVGANGQRLSGGQRQRIALARALLRDPEILILDEATSQIDMHSEQLIRQSLAEHKGRRTVIIITHREKLLELADHVFEVRSGKLVEMSGQEDVISTQLPHIASNRSDEREVA